ncbi:MAG: RsmE family RNA methyltransferase [Thermodesulforhabdaceae bacterium]|jgi:16S rRNA (uracil1498-N3)-methyltransferase
MTRRIFFLPRRLVEGKPEVILPEDISHQIVRVLRLSKGDTIELRDEDGRSWKAEIVELAKKGVRVSLTEEVFSETESPLDLILLLALARSDRVDLAIRQATELGVKKIFLFSSARSPYRIEKFRISDKVSRWGKIVKEAVCQCRRRVPPEIDYIGTTKETLEFVDMKVSSSEKHLKIVASEYLDDHTCDFGRLAEKVKAPETVLVAIGPEGGWTMEELDFFRHSGWHPVSCGPRILRYETAVVTALSLCQFLWGDMRLNR